MLRKKKKSIDIRNAKKMMKFTLILTLFLIQTTTFIFPAHSFHRTQHVPFSLIDVKWGEGDILFEPEPGDGVVPLTIILAHQRGAMIIEGVEATLILPIGFSDSVGSRVVSTSVSGKYHSGEEIEIKYKLNIDEDLSLGIYDAKLNIKFNIFFGVKLIPLGGHIIPGDPVNLTVPIKLLGKVSFSIYSEPNVIVPGTNNFTLTLHNTGEAKASSVDISLVIPPPLATVAEDNHWYFSSISAFKNVSATMALYASVDSIGLAYQVPVTVMYRDAYGSTRVYSDEIGLVVGNGTVHTGKFAINQIAWGELNNPKIASPGDKGLKLFLVIQNLNNQTVSGIDATLFLTPPFSSVTDENLTSGYIDVIRPGQTGNLRFTLNILPGASIGVYSLKMELRYLIENPLSKPMTYVSMQPIDLSVPVPLLGRGILSITTMGNDLTSGSTNELDIVITNKGTADILSLDVTLMLPAPSPGISLQTSPLVLMNTDNQWHFDTVKPKDSVIINTRIVADQNIVGNYQSSLTLKYKDPMGYTYSETRMLGLSVSLETLSSLVGMTSYKISSNPLYLDETFTISLSIENLGDSPAGAVQVDLVAPPALVPMSPTTISIGDLSTGSTAFIDYTILISSTANPGVAYTLEFDILYTDSLGQKQVTRTYAGIPVYGRLKVIVYDLEVEPRTVMAGSEVAISGDILNRGDVSAKYTNVTILSGSPLNLWLGSTEYIGEVHPDSPTSFEVTADIEPNTKVGTYPVTIQISYEDDRYVTHTFTKLIQIQVAEEPPQSAVQELQTWLIDVGWIYAVVGAMVIAFALYLRRRKRRSKD